jgi:hypothetical protein
MGWPGVKLKLVLAQLLLHSETEVADPTFADE